MARSRQERTLEEQVAANSKNKAEQAKHRQNRSSEERVTAKAKHKAEQLKHRQNRTSEEQVAAKAKNKAEQQKHREARTSGERVIAKKKHKAEQKKYISGCKAHVDKKEGLKSKEILEGSHPVLNLKDSVDTIGQMEIVCQHCGALKFKKETGTTCCSNGKVYLEPLPQPPMLINKLWYDDTQEGRLFRQNARSINNAVCLTSIKGKQKLFGGGFAPSIVYEGKVTYLVGPLQAAEGEKPCFAQLYVHDPSLETGLRLSGMTIPAGTSEKQKNILKKVLHQVQKDLHKFNPFVRDFKQIMEIPDTDLAEGKIVISAKARPTEEHERRYNQQVESIHSKKSINASLLSG